MTGMSRVSRGGLSEEVTSHLRPAASSAKGRKSTRLEASASAKALGWVYRTD